jgi:hypothetical protein
MARSLAFSAFFMSVLMALFFFACKEKTTMVNGIIIDKHTRAPIQDASISFRIFLGRQEDNEQIISNGILTDANGRFSFEEDRPIQFFNAHKEMYFSKDRSLPIINQCENNEPVIEMVPKDAHLRLTVQNTGPLDTLYVGIYSNIQREEFGLSSGIIFLKEFSVDNAVSQNVLISTAAEETVTIYWGFSPMAASAVTLAPYQASVYLPRNDTTSYTISF